MTKKKTTYSIGIVLLALLIGLLAGIMSAPRLASNNKESAFGESLLSQRVGTAMELIDNFYVDEVDYDSVTGRMMNAMLSTLDPHSYYLMPVDFEKEEVDMRGRFEGIGVTLYYMGDSVYASHVMPGSPAAASGLHTGDLILRVDTTLVSGSGLTRQQSEVVDLIRGPRYSTVCLTVMRKGLAKPKAFKIRRDVIHLSTVPAIVMLDKKIGYVRITRFGDNTAGEFHAALLQLLGEGMRHLVLDLRGNGGGSLASAVGVCNELLPKGDLIVYTQGAHDRRRNTYATKGGLFEEGGLTVLIDEGSASASEIVAGAVQDNDRGTIIGHRSFGKGLVQHQFEMTDGSALLLTIARYYTPSGRCIQRPYDKGSDEYYREYVTRIIQNYSSADSILDAEYDTTQSFLTKKGRKVYGGGGIRPDILLPYFTDTNLVYYNRLVGNNVLGDVAHRQLYEQYDLLMGRYPTVELFVKGYQVDEATWREILALGDQRHIARSESGISKYGKDIRNRYKAILAMSLYGENAYYTIAQTGDIELQRALREVRSFSK